MPTITGETLQTAIDAVGRICAEALGGEDHVFAAGVTQDVLDAEPMVVPLADDFSEAGMPAATLAIGEWKPVLQPGQERFQLELLGAIWVPRVPLGENVAALLSIAVSLTDAFIAHGHAFGHEATVQSVTLMGGPGIRQRSLPKGSGFALFLTLPFTVDLRLLRSVVPKPA